MDTSKSHPPDSTLPGDDKARIPFESTRAGGHLDRIPEPLLRNMLHFLALQNSAAGEPEIVRTHRVEVMHSIALAVRRRSGHARADLECFANGLLEFIEIQLEAENSGDVTALRR